jgi:hypothetical protein
MQFLLTPQPLGRAQMSHRPDDLSENKKEKKSLPQMQISAELVWLDEFMKWNEVISETTFHKAL